MRKREAPRDDEMRSVRHSRGQDRAGRRAARPRNEMALNLTSALCSEEQRRRSVFQSLHFRICDGGFLRSDDLVGNIEELVELDVLGFGGGAFADFQEDVPVGGQHDGRHLVGLERLPDRRPGGVDSFVQKRLLDRDKQV